MLLAEVVWVSVEGGTDGLSDVDVIGARVSHHNVALADKGLGEKLTKVPKPHNGNFQLHGAVEGVRDLGFVVVRLGRVDCPNLKAPPEW